jgi:F420-dependent oxidoreductase-like protein
VLSGQARQFRDQHGRLADDGFDVVLTEATRVRTAPAHVAREAAHADRQRATPIGLRFALQVPTFDWPGGAAETRSVLAAIGRTAEDAGFESIWLMDHYRQIPMFGPAWHDMLECYTALTFLAAHTERVRLGALVTGIAQRPVAHLGKVIATLDVVSGGRASCGLGVGWFAAENRALGVAFPPLAERYALLEDALQFLPQFWGKGTPTFEGRVLQVPEALCYPRPLQEHVPILVGGNGQRRTLRLAAQYADACNIIGEADVVARKVDVLQAHCADVGRPPESVEVTQLSTTLIGKDTRELSGLLERWRPRRTSAEHYAARVNAGTVPDQIGRFRALAQAGVQTAIVSFPDLVDVEPIERFRDVIDAFRAH